MYNNVIWTPKSWYKVGKKLWTKGKNMQNIKIMETNGVAILAFRHWDSPKIKNKQANICYQKNGTLWKTFKLPQKNRWSHATHHNNSDGERFSICLMHSSYEILCIVYLNILQPSAQQVATRFSTHYEV